MNKISKSPYEAKRIDLNIEMVNGDYEKYLTKRLETNQNTNITRIHPPSDDYKIDRWPRNQKQKASTLLPNSDKEKLENIHEKVGEK